jgi:hypothetical protein
MFNTLLFADGWIILSDSEYEIQRVLYTSHNTKEQFEMKTYPLRSNVVALKDMLQCHNQK